MYSDTEDIPLIPDRQARFDQLLMDTYGPDDELSAFEVYFTDALKPPFAASWRDPDEESHAEAVTVTGVADVDDRRGVLLAVARQGGKERRIPAEELWADEPGVNATILDDYRSWIDSGGLDIS